VDGGYASIVALRGLGRAGLPLLQHSAAGLEGVQWVDQIDEISSVLGRYRQYMGWVVFLSYVAVYGLLYPRYGRAAWRVLAATALASVAALALLGIAGQNLQLFHMLALMLVLGIGVDYGIFFQEHPDRRDPAAWLAVSLSASSALLSFGLLGLSNTPALQAFGLTMLIGIATVWLIAPCFGKDEMGDDQAKLAKVAKVF
jgi:predicted exporter